MPATKALPRITFDLDLMGQTVHPEHTTHHGNVVGLLSPGHSAEEIPKAYPYLKQEDVRQALPCAAWPVKKHKLLLSQA